MKRSVILLIFLSLLMCNSCTPGSSTPALKFVTTVCPPGVTTIAYSKTIDVRGGRTPYMFTLQTGPLPAGLALSTSTGVISGTPSAAGVYNFTIRLTDSSKVPQYIDQQYSIEIVELLEITTTKLGDGSINIPYSDFVVVKGGKQPFIFTLASGTLPSGYSLNISTGEISGTSTTTNSYNFEIQVADSSNPKQIVKKSYSIAISPPFGSWAALSSTSGQPSARYKHHSFYDTKQDRVYVMWGTDGATYFNDGAYYSFSDNKWHSTYLTGAPSGTLNGSCVEMGDPPSASGLNHYMFWGGETSPGSYVNTGGMYGTENNRWGGIIAPVSTSLPSARSEFVSVSLGNYEAFFFGGILQGGSLTNDAYHYTFNDSTFESVWTKTNTPPISGRRGAKGVKVGNSIYVWGGMQATTAADTGAYYNTLTKNWASMNQTNAPSARWNHVMIAVGNKIVVWGGDDNAGNYFNDGAVYDTSSNTWTTMNLGGAPTKRSCSSVVYNSSSGEIYIWGGWDGNNYFNSGGAYKVSTDGWRTLTITGAPDGRKDHTAVWTGSEMIVYGGINTTGPIQSPKAFNP